MRLQNQDLVLRSLNPYAYPYIGLSLVHQDFRPKSGNQEYVDNLRALLQGTNLHKYLDEPEGVRAVLPSYIARCGHSQKSSQRDALLLCCSMT